MKQTSSTAVRNRGSKNVARGSSKVTTNTPDIEVEILDELDSDISSVNPGYVSVTAGITKNLGNYESAKIGVTVSLPCEPSIEGAEARYTDVSVLVDRLMDEEFKRVSGEDSESDAS